VLGSLILAGAYYYYYLVRGASGTAAPCPAAAAGGQSPPPDPTAFACIMCREYFSPHSVCLGLPPTPRVFQALMKIYRGSRPQRFGIARLPCRQPQPRARNLLQRPRPLPRPLPHRPPPLPLPHPGRCPPPHPGASTDHRDVGLLRLRCSRGVGGCSDGARAREGVGGRGANRGESREAARGACALILCRLSATAEASSLERSAPKNTAGATCE